MRATRYGRIWSSSTTRKTLQALQRDVESPVGQRLGVRDQPGAADGVDRRPSLVLGLESRLQQHHPDDPVVVQRVAHHRAIARLENVQR
jgi:hypothetical protein